MFSRTPVCPPCRRSDSKVREQYAAIVAALEKLFDKKSSTEPANDIDLSNMLGVVKGDCKFCKKPVYNNPHCFKRKWPTDDVYSHGNTREECDKWEAWLNDLKQTTTAKAKPRRTSWKVWKFIQINPLTIMTLLVLVLIFVIMLMAGLIDPIIELMKSILKGLGTWFLDLFKGMLCDCGKDWKESDWVKAELAEGYLNTIASLKTENLNLQRQLDWANFQRSQMPGWEFNNTTHTPEATPTSLFGAMQSAMNVVTAVVTGAGMFLACKSAFDTPDLAALAGVPPMSPMGKAAEQRRTQ